MSASQRRRIPALAGLVLLLLAAAPAYADGLAVVVEGGAVAARGDLAESYDTGGGYDAGLGFEAGARLRRDLSPGWDASLVFCYARFGSYESTDADLNDFAVRTSAYRYGAELRRVFGADATLRPFAEAGFSLVRNRYAFEYLETDEMSTNGQNSVSLNVGGGFVIGNVEVTAQYHRNRFDTQRFRGDDASRNWDHVSLRIGLKLPESFQ